MVVTIAGLANRRSRSMLCVPAGKFTDDYWRAKLRGLAGTIGGRGRAVRHEHPQPVVNEPVKIAYNNVLGSSDGSGYMSGWGRRCVAMCARTARSRR